MNILFGIWRPNGLPVTSEELYSMAQHTRQFAPDGEWIQIAPEIGFGVQAQYTHARSRLEMQPVKNIAGNVVVACDGRLDNYRDLARELDLRGEETSDSEIILHAYERWGEGCFLRLIGDWALVLWDSRMRALYLVRDHAGTRMLHYSQDAVGTITWATFLDSYLNTAALDALDSVYLASYLAQLPCYARTPYRNVRSVLPGHFMIASQRGIQEKQFWLPELKEFSPRSSTEDRKVEFLHLLEKSIERRTPPGAPALAQLSGGMDSTSIVCVADRRRDRNPNSQGPIQTLSYFNDSDPAWNERPYFTLVEARRGQTGIHIDSSRFSNSFSRPTDIGARYLYPGIDESTIKRDAELLSITHTSGHRVIISGIGGDEFTGGLANPESEVAQLLLKGRILRAFQQTVAWCLDRRISAREFSQRVGSYLIRHVSRSSIRVSSAHASWLTETARRYCLIALTELPLTRFIPPLTSLRACDFAETWWSTLRTQPHLKPSEVYRYEYRYPYLDRDLLEFLLRVPVDELARPGRRRFLMRSALEGIVPQEVLERRRKAYLLSSPLSDMRQIEPLLTKAIKTSELAMQGFVDHSALESALDSIIAGKDIRSWAALSRFAALETWIQHRNNVAPAGDTARLFVGADARTDQVPAPWAPIRST